MFPSDRPIALNRSAIGWAQKIISTDPAEQDSMDGIMLVSCPETCAPSAPHPVLSLVQEISYSEMMHEGSTLAKPFENHNSLWYIPQNPLGTIDRALKPNEIEGIAGGVVQRSVELKWQSPWVLLPQIRFAKTDSELVGLYDSAVQKLSSEVERIRKSGQQSIQPVWVSPLRVYRLQ